MTKYPEILKNLQRFANEHKIILENKGEVGFGRSCVGFLHGDNYIDYNPLVYPNLNLLWEYDKRLEAPSGVEAYHKHDCLCVLVHNENYDEALLQLHKWISYLERQGELEVVCYDKKATGMQMLLTGVEGRVIKFKEKRK